MIVSILIKIIIIIIKITTTIKHFEFLDSYVIKLSLKFA